MFKRLLKLKNYNDREIIYKKCIFYISQIQEAVLSRWVNDAGRMDRRTLALVILAHAADVLENAFAPLSDDDYELAMRRVRTLLDLDFEAEAAKPNANPVLWAVFAAFTK